MTAVRKPVAEIEYPETDGLPMAETDLHRKIMTYVIERLSARYASRKDVYVSGNLLVYYEEGQWGVSLAPDCMVVFGVPPGDRRIFKTWEEGKYPSVVIEITSRATQFEDMFKKLRIYEQTWKVKEVFLFDPTQDYLKPSLLGYRLSRGEYVQLKTSNGRLVCRELGITLERDKRRLILRDSKSGKELLLPAEAETARLRAELAALKKRPRK
jgi:Uma2 family endonuclease